MLYNLFDSADRKDPTFVMTASMRTIEEYLGAQVPRTFARSGKVSFTIDHDAHGSDRHHRVGRWTVAKYEDRRGAPRL